MDRYSKIIVTLATACLAVIAFNLATSNTAPAYAADPPSKGSRCEWTTVSHWDGSPGTAGKGKMSGGWQELAESGGWHLVLERQGAFYFERCR